MPEPVAALTGSQLARLTAAARQGEPLALLRAVDALGQEAMGHRLCTAMRFDAAAMTVQRIYSSAPEAYPVGGAKPKRDTAWGRRVLMEQRLFIGEGESVIRAHFDDHATILGLGLRSIINVPVVRRGRCLGTLNFLWPEDTVRPGLVTLVELFGLVVTPDWAL